MSETSKITYEEMIAQNKRVNKIMLSMINNEKHGKALSYFLKTAKELFEGINEVEPNLDPKTFQRDLIYAFMLLLTYTMSKGMVSVEDPRKIWGSRPKDIEDFDADMKSTKVLDEIMRVCSGMFSLRVINFLGEMDGCDEKYLQNFIQMFDFNEVSITTNGDNVTETTILLPDLTIKTVSSPTATKEGRSIH